MIGLVDINFQSSTSSTSLKPPNLEIMKLATYYKTEENTFCRLVSLDETEFTNYDKIYCFSEQEDPVTIPDNFRKADNIIYGGTAFTNGIYIPFENVIIDYTIPRPEIYKSFLKQKYNDGIKAKTIAHILDDTYYRHYAGNNKLPLPAIIPAKRVFLYDKEFFYPDWEDLIQEITRRKASTIICIHPIVCRNLKQYFSLRSKTKIARSNEIILDLNIPLSDVNYMLKTYGNKFLGDITFSSNVYLTLGSTFSSSFQYYHDFIYKMNLLYSFWSRGIPIKIKYIEPQVGVKDILSPLSKNIETWTKNIKAKNKTINERIILKTKKDTPEVEAKQQLLKFHPEAKDLFDQSYDVLLNRRFWRI